MPKRVFSLSGDDIGGKYDPLSPAAASRLKRPAVVSVEYDGKTGGAESGPGGTLTGGIEMDVRFRGGILV